jgi:serine kinase of HPr protein (carbohydrate metabolism regulator)
MAHGKEGTAWVTVQTHLNVIAVACLHDFACVIIPENITVPKDTIQKADEEGMPVLSCGKTGYGVCGELASFEIPEV